MSAYRVSVVTLKDRSLLGTETVEYYAESRAIAEAKKASMMWGLGFVCVVQRMDDAGPWLVKAFRRGRPYTFPR